MEARPLYGPDQPQATVTELAHDPMSLLEATEFFFMFAGGEPDEDWDADQLDMWNAAEAAMKAARAKPDPVVQVLCDCYAYPDGREAECPGCGEQPKPVAAPCDGCVECGEPSERATFDGAQRCDECAHQFEGDFGATHCDE